MVNCGVLFEVRTEFFSFRGLKGDDRVYVHVPSPIILRPKKGK
jgi:hypothetical protein